MGNRNSRDRVRAGHLVAYGFVAGLIAIGSGGLFSWLVYGSSNPVDHPPAMALVVVLTLMLGLTAYPMVAWLVRPATRDDDEGPLLDGQLDLSASVEDYLKTLCDEEDQP